MKANTGWSTVYFLHSARMLSSLVGSYCGWIALICRQLMPPCSLIHRMLAEIDWLVLSLLKFEPNANADCTAPRFGIGITTSILLADTPWSVCPAGLRQPAGPCVPPPFPLPLPEPVPVAFGPVLP